MLAAFRWMDSSNLVGCSNGKCPGFVPFNILSTEAAVRRNRSEMPVSRRRRRIRRPISMPASTADRGLSLAELDLDLDFLRMGRSVCNPKATARGGLGDFYSIHAHAHRHRSA